MDSIASLFIVYRYDSTTGTFTVPPGGDGFYYFYVYCLQIRQYNWNIHSAPWWRWILLLLCLLFTDITVQPEHSQCPLVEMDSIASLFIVYRYDSTTEHSQCPLVDTDTITPLFIVYRYDSTTGTFTVPPGGDGFYYFSVYCLQILQYNRNIHSAP